jgi:hypothetical protein
VVGYGFHAYGLVARTGLMAWLHGSATPIVALLGSSRIEHVVVVAEIETVALAADGGAVWRVAHSDVVQDGRIVGGRLVLTSYGGAVIALDPRTGQTVT